jgi:uncharacterized protein (DUF885 family)
VADPVERLARAYLDRTFEAFPTAATQYGVHDFDDRLEELTDAGLDAYARAVAELRGRVAAVEVADAEAAADRDALDAELAERLEVHEVERPWHRNPFEAATAVPNAILLLLVKDFAPLERRLGDAAARLEAAPRLLAQARALLDEPCPALWRRMAVAAARGGAGFLGGTLPSLAAGTPLAGRVAEAAGAAAAALEDLAGWLETEHATRFPDDAPFAIGEAALARRLRQAYRLDVSPAELLATGEAQLAELEEALAAQAARLGGDDWGVTLERLKDRHPPEAELVGAYQQELERLQAFCFERDLVTDPAAKARVEPTPEYLRGLLGYAAYLPSGPFDEHQQGSFWVTPPAEPEGLREHFLAVIPAVAAHEGYPGHHLQMTSVNRLASVTRRTVQSAMMIEGWGLYTEELMHDAGYYGDAARLAQLNMRSLRALRIVLDMRLQADGLSYQDGVALAVSAGRLTEPTARTEVARYTMTPTQPSTYLLGCLELERLRAASQARLGGAFRLREFHDRVLAYGHMPPTLVARAIQAADLEQRRTT